MRDSIIYLRNNLSILFWRAGNTGVTEPQMAQMVALRKEFDPHGGRVMGCRSLREPGAAAVAELWGTMLRGPYNTDVRNREPIIETEDFRDEGARRFWDNDSPPKLYLKTEAGINRVAIRSTLTPGTIKVTATRDGLNPATVNLQPRHHHRLPLSGSLGNPLTHRNQVTPQHASAFYWRQGFKSCRRSAPSQEVHLSPFERGKRLPKRPF